MDIDKFLKEHDSFLYQGKGVVRGEFAEGTAGRRQIEALLQKAYEQGVTEAAELCGNPIYQQSIAGQDVSTHIKKSILGLEGK